MAMNIRAMDFRVMRPCNIVGGYQNFGEKLKMQKNRSSEMLVSHKTTQHLNPKRHILQSFIY